MLYTDYQSSRTAAIVRHVSFAQITCSLMLGYRNVDNFSVFICVYAYHSVDCEAN